MNKMNEDLHSGLKTEVVGQSNAGGIHFLQVRVVQGKNRSIDGLHGHPSAWTSSGLQATDFLSYLGFRRDACPFHRSECYSKAIPPTFDLPGFCGAAVEAFNHVKAAGSALESCGLFLDQPEGSGFFFGEPSRGSSRSRNVRLSWDGHNAAKSEKLKESQDDHFRYVLNWLDGREFKGWVTHYGPLHGPLSPEFKAALEFLGSFREFSECPEFEFDPCQWRAYPHKAEIHDFQSTEAAHRWFDAHAKNFSRGIHELLNAHARLEPFGMSFLMLNTALPAADVLLEPSSAPKPRNPSFEFDVAISFAGTERELAESLAKKVKTAGFAVFYDNFYPEQLWGKDLAAFFDRIYRKAARYCVMFVSSDYATRMWTTHERRSATARLLAEKGNEYILPIRVGGDLDIDGLPPTLGYLSLKDTTIDHIGDILIRKLQGAA
jgi:hypothetical protein